MASDADKLADAKAAFEECSDAEADNREAALDDLRFARLGEQWDSQTEAARARDSRPCLTINRLPAFIRQVVNDVRQNRPQIKVGAVDSGADRQTANILSGIIRGIEHQSRADTAYDTAADFAVTMGWGYFRVDLDYAHEDTFDVDLLIKRVGNPFSIYSDPRGVEADSSDWNVAFVTDLVAKDDFERRYKGAEAFSWEDDGYAGLDAPWRNGDDVLVAEHWYRDEVEGELVKLSNGMVLAREDYERQRELIDVLGVTVAASRPTKRWRVTRCVMTGAEVLEEKVWPGKYIPIVPVYGEELNIEGARTFRSLIRDAKDAQRMFNYWRSATAELVALAPKTPFIGPEGAFDIDADKWATANSATHPFIRYAGQIPPQRQPFVGVPAGTMQEALSADTDMKSIMGMYDASLGARSNETSGKAIMARQREGDVSTFHFIDNLSRAIRHGGAILLDLIPRVYTAGRVARVLGEDGGEQKVALGQPVPVAADGRPVADGQQAAAMRVFDLTAGKYDLTVTAGPSFTSRRDEAATQMIEMVRAFPAAAPIMGDLIAKNLDWPGADEIERRLKSMLPPQAQQQMDPRFVAMAQENEALKRELVKMQTDRQVEQEQIKVKQFEAQTGRLKVVGDLAAKAAAPMQPMPPMPQQVA